MSAVAAEVPHHCREATFETRWQAVERAIAEMREHLDEPLSLGRLARAALLSPYHFHRVFRGITGVPPGRFLTALRMDEAKRLLLTTDGSVTEICLSVGYRSLGTFTTQFHTLVGVSPKRLRRVARQGTLLSPPPLAGVGDGFGTDPPGDAGPCAVDGEITTPDDFHGSIFVGLYATALPQGRPLACALLAGPGRYRLVAPRRGRYHILVAGFPHSDDPCDALLATPATRIARVERRLAPMRGRPPAPCDLALRPPSLVDPPILTALPALLQQLSPELSNGREEQLVNH